MAHRRLVLRHIIKIRDEGYTIVYTDETYIHSSHSVTKAWKSESTGLNQPLSKVEELSSCMQAQVRDLYPFGI